MSDGNGPHPKDGEATRPKDEEATHPKPWLIQITYDPITQDLQMGVTPKGLLQSRATMYGVLKLAEERIVSMGVQQDVIGLLMERAEEAGGIQIATPDDLEALRKLKGGP